MRKVWIWMLFAVLAGVLVACGGAEDGDVESRFPPAGTATPGPVEGEQGLPETGGYPNGELLVDVDWLVEHLEDPGVRVFDLRSPAAYEQGHVPGAVNVPVGEIAASVDEIPFEYNSQGVQEALNRSGLDPDMTAVIYDDLGMMDAARMFWTLEYAGHERARILNGGWNAWVAAGGEQSQQEPQIEATEYPVELDEDRIASAAYVLDHLDDPQVAILDARSPQEYSGEVRLAERGGHIPGAINLVWLDLLEGGDAVYTIEEDWQEQLRDEDVEVFKPADEIEAMLEELDLSRDQEVITYCQTLWRGAHAYYVLRLMGFERVRGYDGSWAEWGNDPDLPVESSTANGQ